MADLDGLRSRVEQIDVRLKAAHRTREKESAALMDMWEQIRTRLVDQNAEISQLRNRVAELEDARDDLLGMVHGLLSAVEGGLERMSDETVPQIRAMAGSLLGEGNAQPLSSAAVEESPSRDQLMSQDVTEGKTPPVSAPNFHDDLLSAIEQSIENVRSDVARETERTSRKAASGTVVRNADVPASPGIRDLVARIEDAVGPDVLVTPPTDDDDIPTEDDELSRDLREIEALRGELNGLRERIASGS